MDDFEKLARLAGASVDPLGEGLPRTWSEAKALGVARYFTGKTCKHGHVAERFSSGGRCCKCKLLYAATSESKEYMRRYSTMPESKESDRRYSTTPERKEHVRLRKLAKTGDEILFAINQAERCAVSGKVASDIIPQCPEPTRSQLQAIVDRIKAERCAGKAVIGLLRTMRELRKAELAEMRLHETEG